MHIAYWYSDCNLSKIFRAYVGMVLARKEMIQTYGHTLETKNPQLRSFTDSRVVDGLYKSSWVPKQSSNCSIFGLFLVTFGPFLATFEGREPLGDPKTPY